MNFDPVRKRETVEEFALMFALDRTPKANGPIGGFATGNIGDVVGFWLVSVETDLFALLCKSIQWIDAAIAHGECLAPLTAKNWWQEELWMAKALGQWMLADPAEHASWLEALRSSEASLLHDTGVYQAKHIPTRRLDRYMGYCILAGDYERGRKEYERYHPAAPLKLTSINSPRAFAYALCRFELLGEADAAFVHRAGRKVLAMHLQSDWLGHGQWLNAALWLHAVYSHRSARATDSTVPSDARGIILRAYDNMPQVTRPDFVK